MGGGKALDVGKGCAIRLGARFVSVPTVASNDSPTASALAVYDLHHRMVAVESLGRNPEAVVVDTQLVAGAPAQFLRAGMGDAIAKKFEGEGSQALGGLNAHFTRQLRTGAYIANGCYETIRAFGEQAMAAAGSGVPNEAFEAVVEANILMAGLGFENMGLGLAHGLTRGLVRTPQVDRAPHGYHVAYGVLVQLAAEGRPEEYIADLAEFYKAIGLPRSLTELGLDAVTPEILQAIAENTTVAPKGAYLVVGYDAGPLVKAMEAVERQFQNSARECA
jgi:glycerol dehydrogenase